MWTRDSLKDRFTINFEKPERAALLLAVWSEVHDVTDMYLPRKTKRDRNASYLKCETKNLNGTGVQFILSVIYLQKVKIINFKEIFFRIINFIIHQVFFI